MTSTEPAARPVAVGETFSGEHRFTPDEVRAFATLMGDTNPLHPDAALAARSRYGGLIASGTHTTALLMGLTASHFSKRAPPVVGVSFSIALERAVAADATVSFGWTVVAVQPHKGGPAQLVDLEGELRDGDGRTCVTATGRVLVRLDAGGAT
jgi:acyl dehydratase